MTDREKAKREYLGGKSLKEIADELGAKPSTVRAWKSREGWPNVQRKRMSRKKNVATAESVAAKSPTITEPLNDKQQLFAELYVRSFHAVQAYMTAYGCEYITAASRAYKLMKNPAVRSYIEYLKELKKESLMAGLDDVVEKMIEVAFSDIGNYITFGRRKVPVMGPLGPVMVKDEESGKKYGISKTINYVDIKESWQVDTSLISEISQGKDGVKIKMQDQSKAREWLGKFFNAFPMDRHRIEYDRRKQELDRLEYERRKKKDESEDF